MSRLDKKERKSRIQQWSAAQRAALIASMPLTPEQLNCLLDYLDDRLTACDRTTKLTRTFLEGEHLDPDRVLPWLGVQGGYCDCEVLLNLDDLAESFADPPPWPIPGPKVRRPARDLANPAGWDVSALPRPWRVANLYSADEPLRIELGKKGGCTIQFVQGSLPPGDRGSESYWRQLWYARTDLPERGTTRVLHGGLGLPGHLRATVVDTLVGYRCFVGSFLPQVTGTLK